jgi:uncharacterized protein (TIGR02646 family)
MRKIDLNLIAPDCDWDAEAAAAEAAVQDGGKITDYSDVWRSAKQRLKKVSRGKCWYCEARQDRSDNAVDHFRPKSLYPWLAFKLNNFRYACTFCNSVRTNPDTGESEGKGDHFPLFAPPRAKCDAELNSEDFILVDPCRGTDPGLLDFREDGAPCARYPDQSKRRDRAEQSIKYYHLDHPELLESRRQLALQLRDWIDGADSVYDKLDQGDAGGEHAFSRFAESICRALREGAEFSVFARRIVEGFRDREWVEDLLRVA